MNAQCLEALKGARREAQGDSLRWEALIGDNLLCAGEARAIMGSTESLPTLGA
jgi:hypothetical protein